MTSGLSERIREVAFKDALVYRVPPDGDVRRRYLEWWVHDLPPMHGLLRFAFYAGLFLLAHQYHQSPFLGFQYYEATSPELFRSYGLIGLLGIPYIAPDVVRVIIVATQVAWILAAIGLFSRPAAIATAAGVTFLHGLFLGSNAFNHNYFLPTYALIALCFTRTTDQWSVDYYLRQWRAGRSSEPETLADTGLALKAFLVVVVGFYFAAGVSKLATAGPIWADGHTIAYFAAERGGRRLLAPPLAENLRLSTLLAVGTLALELGAPAALFSRRARYALILGWTGMHIGIRYSMGPRYWENILCFALLIDWRAAARTFRERLGLPNAAKERATLRPMAVSDMARTARGVAAASLLVPLVAGTAVFQVFWWPVTNVYMYCSYFSLPHDIRADHPRADYHDATSAQEIARGYLERSPAIEATEHFAFLAELRLSGGVSEPFAFDTVVPGISTHKQWILSVVRPVLIEDLATKPEGRIEYDPGDPDFPAQRLLLEYLPVLRRHADPRLLERYDRLELTYPLAEGRVPIASVRLDATGD